MCEQILITANLIIVYAGEEEISTINIITTIKTVQHRTVTSRRYTKITLNDYDNYDNYFVDNILFMVKIQWF